MPPPALVPLNVMWASSHSTDLTGDLLQYGVLGMVVIALLAGRVLVPAWVYTTVRDERDAARAELAALRAKYEEVDARRTDALTAAVEELTKAAQGVTRGPRR